ncbi:hypothetical protein JCM11641_008179 [Rhodosporidiobolus odoratus]
MRHLFRSSFSSSRFQLIMLSHRYLHSTTRTTARLVGSSLSVAPDFAHTAPPPPPPSPTPRTPFNPSRPPRPPAASGTEALTSTPPASPAQPTAKQPPHRPSGNKADGVLEWRFENREARRGSGFIEQEAQKVRDEEEVQTGVALDLFLLRTLAQLDAEVGGEGGGGRELTSLHELVKQRRDNAHRVVEDATLQYEPTPPPARRVRLDGKAGAVETSSLSATGAGEQDGIVVVAHVLGGEDTRVSVCSGFAVGKVGETEGQMILTCAHTLDSIERFVTSSPPSPSTPSATFVLTSSGHVYTVTSLLSSLPDSDLLLLKLSNSPINPSSIPVRRLRSLPINPYPSPTNTGVSVHRYLNPLSRLSRKLQKLPEREWEEGRIAEYKDSAGRDAKPGTYDELACMWLDATPTPGSSGGPVVCRETGSVVGVTRGSSHKYGERQQYGFATPGERILEMFPIPGFKTTAQRHAERETASQSLPATDSSSRVDNPMTRARGRK